MGGSWKRERERKENANVMESGLKRMESEKRKIRNVRTDLILSTKTSSIVGRTLSKQETKEMKEKGFLRLADLLDLLYVYTRNLKNHRVHAIRIAITH